MKLLTLQQSRRLFATLVAAVSVVFVIVTAFVLLTLHQSRERYYANAEETSRNLSIALENFLRSHFHEVDLAVRRAADEFRSLHQQGRFDPAVFSAYLRSLKERVPHARAIRGSDAQGQVIYGEGIDPAKIQNLGIREFYQRARTERTLVFGVPVQSRISGEWLLPLIPHFAPLSGSGRYSAGQPSHAVAHHPLHTGIRHAPRHVPDHQHARRLAARGQH